MRDELTRPKIREIRARGVLLLGCGLLLLVAWWFVQAFLPPWLEAVLFVPSMILVGYGFFSAVIGTILLLWPRR